MRLERLDARSLTVRACAESLRARASSYNRSPSTSQLTLTSKSTLHAPQALINVRRYYVALGLHILATKSSRQFATQQLPRHSSLQHHHPLPPCATLRLSSIKLYHSSLGSSTTKVILATLAPKQTTPPSKSSNKVATPSITPKPGCVDLSPSARYADQRDSRLMSLPQELRNRVYEYVFADNVTWSVEPVKYDRDTGVEEAFVPARIQISQTTPPNKDPILPCHQLYAEMGAMQAAAYREYWTSNRFVCSYVSLAALVSNQRPSPDTSAITHIRHFSFLFYKLVVLDLIFEDGKWNPRVLPAPGQPPEWAQNDSWSLYQTVLEDRVRHHGIFRGQSLDPGLGQGMTSDMIQQMFCGLRAHPVFVSSFLTTEEWRERARQAAGTTSERART